MGERVKFSDLLTPAEEEMMSNDETVGQLLATKDEKDLLEATVALQIVKHFTDPIILIALNLKEQADQDGEVGKKTVTTQDIEYYLEYTNYRIVSGEVLDLISDVVATFDPNDEIEIDDLIYNPNLTSTLQLDDEKTQLLRELIEYYQRSKVIDFVDVANPINTDLEDLLGYVQDLLDDTDTSTYPLIILTTLINVLDVLFQEKPDSTYEHFGGKEAYFNHFIDFLLTQNIRVDQLNPENRTPVTAVIQPLFKDMSNKTVFSQPQNFTQILEQRLHPTTQ